MKGLTPVRSVPAKGDAASTSKSAIAPGSIDMREPPHQDISEIWRKQMFTCKSFLLDLRGTILDLDHIDPTIFTEVTDIEGVRKIAHYIEKDYLEGAIVLSFYDEQILTFRNWDALAALWIYLVTAVDKTMDTGEGISNMASHPGVISFKEHPSGFIKLHTDWNDKRYWLPEKEFVTTLLQGAVEFYEATDIALRLQGKYLPELNYCKELLEKVQERFKWGYHSYLSLPNE